MSLPHTINGIETEPYNTYSAKQNWTVGQRMSLPDGRMYRGTLNASIALESCILVQTEVEATFKNLAIQTALVVGDRSISLTQATTFLAVDEAKGGYVVVWLAGPPPANIQTFRIWSNNVTASGSTTATLQLWPGSKVLEVISTSGKGTIINNPWSKVVIAPASVATEFTAGATVADFAADYYGWVQTRGMCSIKVDDGGTLDPGDSLTQGGTDTGSVDNADPAALQLIGQAAGPAATDDVGFCMLTID